MTTIRLAVLINGLLLLFAAGVVWSDLPPAEPAVASQDPEWVRARDGWQRPDWRRPQHRDFLHPALVAALMAMGSTAILVGLGRTTRPAINAVEGPTSKNDRWNDPDFRATLPLESAQRRRVVPNKKRSPSRNNFANDPASFFGRNILSMRDL